MEYILKIKEQRTVLVKVSGDEFLDALRKASSAVREGVIPPSEILSNIDWTNMRDTNPEFPKGNKTGLNLIDLDAILANKSKDDEGICPVCGAPIEYGDSEDDYNGNHTAHWECAACHSSGTATFTEVFSEHEVEKNGQEG